MTQAATQNAKWREKHPAAYAAQNRLWSVRRRKEKGGLVRGYHRKWWAKQAALKSDTWVAKNLRTRIYLAVKRGQRAGSLPELLGCSIPGLRLHIAHQFKPGMSWDNYGEWHVDHIRPCAKFDLSKPEEQRACFHYTNLQPLWKTDNLVKHDK